MKTKTILILAALAAAVCAHARTVNATWTNTAPTAATIRVDSRTVGDATVANPVWSPWTSTTAKVEPGANYEYLAEGWSLVSKPSAQPPYYQMVEVKVYEAVLAVESYDPPAETWTPFDEPEAWQYGAWSPDPSTIDAGQSYTQIRTNSRHHRTGERSNLNNERGIGGYDETTTETRGAVGTRPIATTFVFADIAHVYDGSPKSATVTASPAAATYTFSPTGGPDAGTYIVTATATGNYSGTASATLTIAKASQTITFPVIGTKTEGDAPFTISATTTSGLPVTFAVLSGPATVSGSTVTITGAGTVVIRASQAGNTNWSAATNVDQSVTIQPGQPVLFANITQLDMGSARTNSTPATTTVTFRITNTGYQTLTLSGISFGNTDYTVIGHDGGAVDYPRYLGAGAGLNVTVMFNPSRIGSCNTTMTISNNTTNPNAVYTVLGLGQDPDLVITWPGPVRLIP